MEALYKERLFALILAVPQVDSFIQKYSAVVDQLTELEKHYYSTDPHFNMSDMWTCNSIKGSIKFYTTRQCVDIKLRGALVDIFDDVVL